MYYIGKDLTTFVELKKKSQFNDQEYGAILILFLFFPECMQSECADTSRAWITTQRNIIKRKVYLNINVYVYVYLKKNKNPFLNIV